MSTATESPTIQGSGPVSMTERAAEEIRKIISAKNIPDGYHLRVGAKGGGCSGMSYILGFDRKRDHDIEFDVRRKNLNHSHMLRWHSGCQM